MRKKVCTFSVFIIVISIVCLYFFSKKNLSGSNVNAKINIEMHFDNLVSNFEKIRKLNNEDVDVTDKVIPVVKANAYNFGTYDITKTFLSMKEPQTKFFVFSAEEGIELRKLFPSIERIFVIMGALDADAEMFKKYNLTPVVNSFYQLEVCKKHNIKDIVLQFNTGMNRNGFETKELKKVKQICDSEKFNVLMVMSHFACSDNIASEVNAYQINEYRKVARVFNDKKIIKSFPATFGILNFNTINGLVNSFRPGRLYYGFLPKEGYNKNLFSVYAYLSKDKEGNIILPFGKEDGVDYGEQAYIVVENKKIYVKQLDAHKVILDTNDKALVGKKVYLLKDGMGYDEFQEQSKRDLLTFFGKIFKNCDKNKDLCNVNAVRQRAEKDINFVPKAIFKKDTKGQYTQYTTTLFEKREVSADGIVGYDATRAVKKGDKLGVIFNGHMDGFYQPMSNKHVFVYVENKNKQLIPCEFYGLISSDQAVIKIPDDEFDNIEYGAKVVVFDKDHPIELFEKATGVSRDELFYGLDKTYRIAEQN